MATLCAGTPKIIVRDNRGLDVRTLRYNRGVAGDVAAQYVDAQTHNDRGQPVSSQDPRFFGSATLNFQHTPALSGQVLQSVSVDAGTANACADIAGRPIWQYSQGRDANLPSDKNITVQRSYDALGRAVQRACYTVNVSGGGSLGGPTDIWSYGDYSGSPGATYDSSDTTDARNANQRGQVLQHFDTAGLIDMSVLGYAVQGTVLREDRRFMATACDVNTHWQPGNPQALYGLNKQRLELDTDPANLYSTQWTCSALGQVLTQADAKGHQQQTAYDCAGRKYTASVTPKGGTYTPVCAGITYTAAGAIDTRRDANNIQVAYVYEPQTTQRLISLTATRVSTQLQALTYVYDGVGNVITLSDSSAGMQVSFFRNRAVTPDRSYTYDALYQLTGATGRENYVNDTPKGTDWPGGGQFSPSNTPDYRPYTRTYTYDLGGNLTTIRSSNWSGAAPPTRELVVGESSNRAVCTANNEGPTQANIDTYFDPAGKSICLDANRTRPMYWTAFHQLYCVVAAYRKPTGSSADWSASDREQYAYDGGGQRVRKYASSMAGNTWNHADTRYLPGLELRSDTASGEDIEVIVLDDGARVLNWVGGAGKPSDIPNLQLRYQYSDRQNSCQIETDSAGNLVSQEEYYPYGGTAVLASRSNSEVKYKYIRYSGKERDATGLYYYGLRYYQPWIGRWINPDPAGTVDRQNLYCMVRNNPITLQDRGGLASGRGNSKNAQDYALLPVAKPKRARYEEATLLEVVLEWMENGVTDPKNPDEGPGMTVHVQRVKGVTLQLWHPFDTQYQRNESVYDPRMAGRCLCSSFKGRLQAMGMTQRRTRWEDFDSVAQEGQRTSSYAMESIIFADRKERLSSETFVKAIAPLLISYRLSIANHFQNLGRQAIENFEHTSKLAREATFKLVVVRILDDAKLQRGKPGSVNARVWAAGGKMVMGELEKRVSADFWQGQDDLFKFLKNKAGERKEVIDSLPDLTPARLAELSAPSKPVRPRGARSHPYAPMPDVAPSTPPRADSPLPEQAPEDDWPATPMLLEGLFSAELLASVHSGQAGPTPPRAQSSIPQQVSLEDHWPSTPELMEGIGRPLPTTPMFQPPSTEGFSSVPMPSPFYAPPPWAPNPWGDMAAPPPQAYGYSGDPYAAGPSHAPWPPSDPWQQSMPVQQAQPFIAPISMHAAAQGYAPAAPLHDNADPNFYAYANPDLPQYSHHWQPGR